MKTHPPMPVVWLLTAVVALSVLSLALFTGTRSHQPSPEPAQHPIQDAVAFVNGQPITHALWRQHTARRGPDGARAALEDLIRQELLFQEATQAGYHQDPELLSRFRRMVAAKFEEERLAKTAIPIPTPEEARAYYDAHPDDYRLPEKRRAAVLFLRVPPTASNEKKAALAQRAHAIREEALASTQGDQHFGALAAKYSEDQATRYTGGDLKWLVQEEPAPRFGHVLTKTLFALTNAGDVSQVIEVPDGLCLVKLVEQQAPSLRPFEEVREGLVYELTRQRERQARQDFEQQLRARAEIQINEAAVAAVSVARQANEIKPPRMPSL